MVCEHLLGYESRMMSGPSPAKLKKKKLDSYLNLLTDYPGLSGVFITRKYLCEFFFIILPTKKNSIPIWICQKTIPDYRVYLLLENIYVNFFISFSQLKKTRFLSGYANRLSRIIGCIYYSKIFM